MLACKIRLALLSVVPGERSKLATLQPQAPPNSHTIHPTLAPIGASLVPASRAPRPQPLATLARRGPPKLLASTAGKARFSTIEKPAALSQNLN